MNERIIKLAEQAGLEYDFNPMLWLKYEKFAELMVRECVDQIREEGFIQNDLDLAPVYAHRILKRFGVEL